MFLTSLGLRLLLSKMRIMITTTKQKQHHPPDRVVVKMRFFFPKVLSLTHDKHSINIQYCYYVVILLLHSNGN